MQVRSAAPHSPPVFLLYAWFLHGNTDYFTIHPNEELRLGKPSEPIVHLLVRQGGEALAVRWCAADEERARDDVVYFTLLVQQGAVQGRPNSLPSSLQTRTAPRPPGS